MTCASWLMAPTVSIKINNQEFSISKEKLELYFIAANVNERFAEVHDYKVAPDLDIRPDIIMSCIIYGLEFGTGTDALDTWPKDMVAALLNFSDMFLYNSWRLVRCLCRSSENDFVINMFDFVKFLRCGKRKIDHWIDFDILLSNIFDEFKLIHPKEFARIDSTMLIYTPSIKTSKGQGDCITKNNKFSLKFIESKIQKTIWISFFDKLGGINFIDFCIQVMIDNVESGKIFIHDDGKYVISQETTEPKKNTDTQLILSALRAVNGLYEFDPTNWKN